MPSNEASARDSIEHRADFDLVRYANCWEDADVLLEALQAGPGKRVLSIAAAGDNAFAILATGAEVVAADINATQLACVELKRAAFITLDYEDVLAFVGVQRSTERLQLFRHLTHHLSSAARHFWEQHPQAVVDGIIHQGKFEAYFRLFRTRVLPWIHSSRVIASLFESRDLAGRITFWNERWNNLRWRALLRIFFSRYLMGKLGRDPEFFRYVKGSIGDVIQSRARYAMTELDPSTNPYLQYIAMGNYGRTLPFYLRPENFVAIREGMDRLSWYHGPIEVVGNQPQGRAYHAMNLSDIFEYVSEQTTEAMYRELVGLAAPGARIAYWNTFVPRRCPTSLHDHVRPLDGLSSSLHAKDKAFFYTHFQVDEVRP
jgi:S-adenosylmethionine-diacylglycerol 3-amino-3-carboxypropyl transferase